MNNYKSNLENKLKNNCLLVFHTGSNYSLSLIKIFIDNYEVTNYKIIFSGNNKSNFKIYYKFLGLEPSRLEIYNGNLNYLYKKFYNEKNKLLKSLKNFIDCKDFIYITSYNYGLINYLILDLFKIKEFALLEDGIINLLNYKIKFHFIKNILYSLIFKKIVILPNDWQNDPKIKLKITSFGKKNESKHINIKKFLTNFIQKNKIEIQTLRKNSKNILILCAKNKHYDNGIKNFINRTIIFFNKKLKQNNEIFFHLKKHPSDDDQVRFNDLNNLIVFPIEHIPIEFFDLFGFDYIISPPNTSLVNIKTNNLFNINNLFYYDIKQTHLAKQIEVMNKYNINKIKI